MKGFNLSTGITLTSFGGWKTKQEKDSSNKGLRGLFNRLKKKRSKKSEDSAEKPISGP